MTGFKITNGDLSLTNNEIDTVEEKELILQTIQTVLSTNKGEWVFDTEEGIEFDNIRGKTINEDIIKSEIEQAVAQVDETIKVDDFAVEYDPTKRILKVRFTAKFEDGESLEVDNIWG